MIPDGNSSIVLTQPIRVGVWFEGKQEFDLAPLIFFVSSANSAQQSVKFYFVDPSESLNFELANKRINTRQPIYQTDYDVFVFITPAFLNGNIFFEYRGPAVHITTHGWNSELSPPSLFEYLFHSMLCGAIYTQIPEVISHDEYSTGCQFEYTRLKEMDRVCIALGYICEDHKNILKESFGKKFLEDIEMLFKFSWLGEIDDSTSITYKLQDVFGFDLRNDSGFKKSFWDRIKPNFDTLWFDFIKEIVKGIILIIIAYIVFKLGLKT